MADRGACAQLEAYGLRNSLEMIVAVAESELGRLGPTREKLHVVLFGESDGAVRLVPQRADAAVSVAYPRLGHRNLPLGRQTLR